MMSDKQIEEYFKKVDKNIRESGYHLTNVFATEDAPSFCYSTGIFKTFDIPEVFISSLPPGLCSEIIENYVGTFKERKEIKLNQRLDFLTDRFSVYLIDVPVSRLKDYVLSSIRIYENEAYTYLQVIYPDTEGNFPNDEGYDYDQEIKGEFIS